MDTAGKPYIAVIGLGYVGLPLAIALARTFAVTGIDSSASRVNELKENHDKTGEIDSDQLAGSSLAISNEPADAAGADMFIITVPTPVDEANKPDLTALLSATELVAPLIDPAKQPIIVYESTVYPGVTEDICGPALERSTGLRGGQDFFLGYSPERINPGDREHSIDKIVKVVAGENAQVTDRLIHIYGTITEAGTFPAKSIKVAEVAKVIENAQRDINIAFMNEIAQLFEPLGLSTWDVLEAANTKWNFLPFHPGLVGGHCIGIDPYYLSFCAEQLGHEPQVILSGRKINDTMGHWIAERLHAQRKGVPGSALILGLSFKEDVPDLRNSRVIDVIDRLIELGHSVTVHDPLASATEVQAEYGLQLLNTLPSTQFDLVLGAVPHSWYREMDEATVAALVRQDGLLADLKGIWRHYQMEGIARWTL